MYHRNWRFDKKGLSSNSFEILNVKDKKSRWSIGTKWSISNQKWVQGPPLPCVVKYAKCVPLLPLTNFACVIIGGWNGRDELYSSDVYGLNEDRTEWKVLGENKNREKKPHGITSCKVTTFTFK